jgi:uncharacterized membrane protein
MHEYLLAKFLHILIAILALGTSAGLGIVLEFFGDDPIHGRFVLRAIHRVESLFVIPGYVLVLITGLWLANMAQLLNAMWVRAALALWCMGLLALIASALLLHKQIALLKVEGVDSRVYRRISLLGRGIGAGVGVVVVMILYLMVFKPQL